MAEAQRWLQKNATQVAALRGEDFVGPAVEIAGFFPAGERGWPDFVRMTKLHAAGVSEGNSSAADSSLKQCWHSPQARRG